MGTIAQKLAKVADTKANIRQAIIDKDVTVPESATFASYPDYIAQISGGVTPTGNIELQQQSGTDVSAYATASVKSGSAAIGAVSLTANPTITVSSSGLITATDSASGTASATTTAGWISSVSSANVTVSGSATKQLTTKGAQTYTPSTSTQTIASGQYLTGTQTISGDSNLVGSNIVSTASIFGVQGTVVINKYYTGTSTPDSSLGDDGDIYIKM